MDTDPSRYLRRVSSPRDGAERISETLFNLQGEGRALQIKYVRTSPGQGSPRGPHAHSWTQFFYVLEGTMSLDIDGELLTAEAGTLVVFPPGVPHRNWNESDGPVAHLAINGEPGEEQAVTGLSAEAATGS